MTCCRAGAWGCCRVCSSRSRWWAPISRFGLFGGEIPGHQVIPRLYWLHVLLLPLTIAGLSPSGAGWCGGAGMPAYPYQRAPGRRGSFQSAPVGTSVAMFFATCGVLALLGALAQVNPIWCPGPTGQG